MIDSFVFLSPVLLLGIVALLRFVGCSFTSGIGTTPTPELAATPGNGQVILTWNSVGAGASYQLTRTDGHPIPPVTDTSYTDTTVVNGTRYCYTVKATVSGNQPSGASTPAKCATPAVLLGRPPGSVVDTGNPLSNNLIGLFLMNEGTGTDEGQPADDTNLVDSQPATHSGAVPPTWEVADPSIVFNGGASLNSFLDAGIDASFNDLPTNSITIVAKVYVNAPTAAGICEKNDGNVAVISDSGFVFGLDNNGALQLTVELSVTNMRVATANGTVGTGQWVQVAFTWFGTIGNNAPATAAALFLNGVQQSNATAVDGSGTLDSSKAANSQPFRIGNASYDVAGSLNGKMAYLAIYKGRILTSAEMMALDMMLPIRPS